MENSDRKMKRILYTLLCLGLLTHTLYGANNKICKDVTQCVKLGDVFESEYPDKAIAFYEEACHLGSMNACVKSGDYYRATEKNSKAKKYYDLALDIEETPAVTQKKDALMSEIINEKLSQNIVLRYAHWGFLIVYLSLLLAIYRKYVQKVPTGSLSVHYAPPEGFSLMQSALLYDIKGDFHALEAGLIELIYLGYVEVGEDLIVHHIHKKKKTLLTDDQRYLLDKVFKNGFNLERRTQGGDNWEFNRAIEKLKEMLYAWAAEEGYTPYNISSIIKSIYKPLLLVLVGVASFGVLLAYGMNDFMEGFKLAFEMVFAYYIVLYGALILLYTLAKEKNSLFKKQRTVNIVTTAIIVVASLFFIFKGVMLAEYMLVIAICGSASIWVNGSMQQLTVKGQQAYRHISGLKEYISRVHKEKMLRELEKDPYYTDALLPYAVYFGEVEHWVRLYGRD